MWDTRRWRWQPAPKAAQRRSAGGLLLWIAASVHRQRLMPVKRLLNSAEKLG